MVLTLIIASIFDSSTNFWHCYSLCSPILGAMCILCLACVTAFLSLAGQGPTTLLSRANRLCGEDTIQ